MLISSRGNKTESSIKTIKLYVFKEVDVEWKISYYDLSPTTCVGK